MKKAVGRVLSSSGEYHWDRVEITLYKNERVYRGEYLYVEVDGKRVFLQVEINPIKRPTSSYDEKLTRDGLVNRDKEREVWKASCWQVGYEENGTIQPYLFPIPPLCEVYRPEPRELENFLTPLEPSITVGRIYPTDAPLKLGLKTLVRQGLLDCGGVGTGKTTLLLTILMALMEQTPRDQPIHVMVIDWDGEFNVPELVDAAKKKGGYLRLEAPMRFKKELKITPKEFYERVRRYLGLAPNSREARKLNAVLMRMRDQAIDWNRETYLNLISQIDDPAVESKLREQADIIFPPQSEEGWDIRELVQENALVHLDFSNAENWDEIILTSRDALDICYHEARTNPRFGVIVVIDEVHNFAPQNIYEAPASKEAYESMVPVMKLLATTGPRNKIPLFVATQRLSEVEKVVSTQMGQNIFAFRVEDIDLERLRGIMGDIASAVRMLPRGHALFKGHAVKVRTPIISVIDKLAEPASVHKDLLSAWRRG